MHSSEPEFSNLGAVFDLGLAADARKTRTDQDPLVERINQLLPQTQCRRCGYPGCRPYAEAIAQGEAEINQCPPGGTAGIRALAKLLDRQPLPLNPENGEFMPPTVAVIDEQACIGCTRCIQACPVDAILGASRQMHTVIADECTGCELCLPPCPVDCIELRSLGAARAPAQMARQRFEARETRLATIDRERRQNLEKKKGGLHDDAEKKRKIAAALSRVQARNAG